MNSSTTVPEPDSNHIILTDAAQIYASPDLFPVRIGPEPKSLMFIPMSRELYRKSSFLRLGRAVPSGPDTYSIEISRLMANLPVAGVGPPSHYILHGAYCGSTLLARYLEALPKCFVLKEPGLLGQFATLKESVSSSGRLEQRVIPWFKVTMALMTRAYPSDTAVIIKPSDSCNWMGRLLLDHDRRTKIVFLLSPLREFLTQVLRPDRDRRARIRGIVEKLKQQVDQVSFLAHPDTSLLSDGQCAATLWLFNNHVCCSLLERPDSDRVLPLKSDDFFSAPGETLRKVAGFIDVTQDGDNRQALTDFTPMTRHSKIEDGHVPYDAATRTSELADAERKILEEIEIAVTWAKQAAGGQLSRSPFPID